VGITRFVGVRVGVKLAPPSVKIFNRW